MHANANRRLYCPIYGLYWQLNPDAELSLFTLVCTVQFKFGNLYYTSPSRLDIEMKHQ